MSSILPIMNDLIVIIFDLLLYTIMFPIKEDKKFAKVYIYGGCVCIVLLYFTATYIMGFPAALSSSICMSIPSFFLFLYFAKYRDSRFVLTFCFIDTISLIVAFIGRFMGIKLRHGEVYAIIIMFLLFSLLLRLAWPYSAKYKRLLDEVDVGWGLMALSTALIYFSMIFFAGYPKPLIERQEYFPVWSVFAMVVISCYTVFIHSIFKTKKISEQNKRLEREKEIYRMAYNDGLTGLYNRASYMEKINDLERRRCEFKSIGLVVADINQFKMVNDTMGHHKGDQVLVAVADCLKVIFSEYEEFIFRMGGDEFLIIVFDETEEKIKEYITKFRQKLEEEERSLGVKTTVAAGYEILLPEEEKSIESVYIQADKRMYKDKFGAQG